MRRVLIWAETSPEIGMGHVKRCLVLANRLKADGFEVEFATYKMPNDEYKPYHVNWLDHLGKFLETSAGAYDYVITDTYTLTPKDLRIIRQYVRYVIVIDDLNNLDLYIADLVINGDYQAKDWKYACTGKVLLGPEYLLIDPKFTKKAYPKEHILVLTGGTNDALVEKIQGIFAVYKPWDNFDLMITPNLSAYKFDIPMQELMQKAFVVVTPCGMSIYEAMACGASIIGYVTAENQRPGADALARDGHITLANSLEEIYPLVENHPVFNLPTYKALRSYPIDSLGAERIVNEIKALL